VQFLDIPRGQAEAEIPAHGQDDDVGWEPEAGERRLRRSHRARATGAHGRQSRCSTPARANATDPSRIVYVDNDPIVLVHARALLTSSPQGATTYVQADLRDPDKILQGAAETLDFTQPVAITLLIHRQVLLSPV